MALYILLFTVSKAIFVCLHDEFCINFLLLDSKKFQAINSDRMAIYDFY